MKKLLGLVALVVLLTPTAVLANQQDNENNDEKIMEPPKLDVVFVIDTTGSMADEIREVKMHIRNIIEEIENGTPKPDIMIGFVIYRDYPDEEREYLTKKFDLTDDIDAAKQFLDEIQASGGGDYKETVSLGLDIGINEMRWREIESNPDDDVIYDDQQNPIYNSSESRRMIFLIGDAPPRTKPYIESQDITITPMDYKENIEDAQDKGIYVYTISGSGMSTEGIEIWKEIAEETNAVYEALVYERVAVEEYVKTHDLDDEWKEKVTRDGDYSAGYGDAPATISTNQLKGFVLDNVQLQAESVGVKYVKIDKKEKDSDTKKDEITDKEIVDILSDSEKLEKFLKDNGLILPFSVLIIIK